jgi:site-specific DNA-methyltransferase (adenine-specific)
MRLILGDCIEKMQELEAESIDSVVCDPPYGINFMGQAWDGKAIEEAVAKPLNLARHMRLTGSPDSPNRKLIHRSGSGYRNRAGEAGAYDFSSKGTKAFQEWCQQWGEGLLRVLKPGAHALVFGSPRTYHRLAAGLEDAGFEIRDCLMWIYGSG